MKHFTNQEIEEAFKKAPKLIQDEISSGEDTAVTITQIGQKYKLHIDQIGVLAELNRNMLLGLVGPQDFLKELVATGISSASVEDIMTEINRKIFVPLRKEEKGMMEAATAPQPVKPIVPAVPQPAPSPSPTLEQRPYVRVPVPTVSPTVQLGHLENRIPTPVRPASPLGQVVRAVVPPQSFSSDKLLEDHEEPHIDLNKKPVMPFVPVIPTAPRVMPAAPTNLPGMMPPTQSEQPLAAPRPAPAPTMPLRPVTRPMPPVTSYSSDPYREPLDEP